MKTHFLRFSIILLASVLSCWLDPLNNYGWIHHAFLGLLSIISLPQLVYYGGSFTIRKTLAHLDPAPPWNLNTLAIHHYPRHYRKHGRYRFVPRYPSIRRDHLWLLFQTLFFSQGTTAYNIDPQITTQLRHKRWSSDSHQPSLNLTYFDVDFTNTSNDPSRIMDIFNRPLRPDWDSAIDTRFALDDPPLYNPAPDEDPSEIMHILCFGQQERELTEDHTPLFYTLMDKNASCYTSTVSSTSPPLIADTGASISITPLRSDFDTYYPSQISIKDLSSSNKVVGEGIIHWHVIDRGGNHHTLKVKGCHFVFMLMMMCPTQSTVVRSCHAQLQHKRVILNI